MKLNHILPFAALLGVFAACSDNSNEYHVTAFNPLKANGLQVYADQVEDSLFVQSSDSWTASTVGDFFSVSPMEQTVQANYVDRTKLTVLVEPNTTGEVREGRILINAYDQIGMPVYQTAWLYIHTPEARYEYGPNKALVGSKAFFEATVKADAEALPLAFKNFRDGATLSCDAPWVTIPDSTYDAGQHTMSLTCEPNPTAEERTATIIVRSAGVETPVVYTQKAKEVEE